MTGVTNVGTKEMNKNIESFVPQMYPRNVWHGNNVNFCELCLADLKAKNTLCCRLGHKEGFVVER